MFFHVLLKGKSYNVPEIKGQYYDDNMKNPPAGFVSHKIFQHEITRGYDREHKQLLCPKSVKSTNPVLKI